MTGKLCDRLVRGVSQMILAATFLLPFVMLGLVFALAWIEERFLSTDEEGTEPWRATAGGVAAPLPIRSEPRIVVRRRTGRHRAPARGFAVHHPPGRRINPRRA
jgi:hypothetical protein